jgi:hypothetical protein
MVPTLVPRMVPLRSRGKGVVCVSLCAFHTFINRRPILVPEESEEESRPDDSPVETVPPKSAVRKVRGKF